MVDEKVEKPVEKHEIHHKTEFVDKQLPTIIIREESAEGVGKYSLNIISVSDSSSKEALATLYQIRKMQEASKGRK